MNFIARNIDGELYVSMGQVNRAIEEKNAEIESIKAENELLKAKLESVQATAYADSVDAGMRERRLNRSLWLARANRALCEIDYWRKCLEHADDYFDVQTGQDLDAKRCERMISKWIDTKIKCLKKAELYK